MKRAVCVVIALAACFCFGQTTFAQCDSCGNYVNYFRNEKDRILKGLHESRSADPVQVWNDGLPRFQCAQRVCQGQQLEIVEGDWRRIVGVVGPRPGSLRPPRVIRDRWYH